MKKNIFAILLILFCGITLGAQNDGVIDYSVVTDYEIGGIEVTGPEYLDKQILVAFSGLSIGDKISIPGEQIPEAINALWRQDLFDNVEITATKIVGDVIFLNIFLEELPRLARYKFTGVKKSEVDDLRDVIPLVSGKVVSKNVKNNTIQKIKAFYANKGFLNTEVVISEKRDNRDNRVTLGIAVDRKRKVKINEIVLHGVDALHPRKVKKKMKDTKEKTKINPKAPLIVLKDIFSKRPSETLANISFADAANYVDDKFRIRLFSSSKFDEDAYNMDKQNIINFYNSKGYRDARIVRDTIYYLDENNLIVELEIDEGQKYYFRNIDWVGNTKYTDEQLSQRLSIKSGDTYDAELLEKKLFLDPEGGDVSSIYMDDGYLFFNVTPVENLVEPDSIDLEMRVYEGPEATINNVIIRGNELTNEHVIRRVIRTKPGSKFRRSDIIRSQREIATLGFFNPETIQINPIPNPSDGTVDIEYTVEEKPSDQLQLSAGWGGGSVYGNIGVSFNNFSLRNIIHPETWKPLPKGDGQTLSINFISNGKRYQSVSLAFTEPWLGGKKPTSLTVALNRSRQAFFTDLRADTAPSRLLNNTSFTVEIGKRLKWPDDYFSVVSSLNYSYYNLKNWFDFVVTNGKFHNLSWKTTFARTSVDAPIYPRSGSLFSLSLELTPPYSLFNDKDYSQLSNAQKFKFPEFHKWKFKGEWYTTVVQNLVLKTSVKMGFLGYYNNQIGFAPFERFRIGGDGLSQQFNQVITGLDVYGLRGYDDSDITNNVVEVDDAETTTFVSVGDPFFNKYTVELRYPFSLNPSSTIYALAFFEAGNSWSTFQEFNPFELRRATGLGLRIYLPMFGMLGFDYGVGFDKNLPSDRTLSGYLGAYGKFSFILGFEPE